jgi:DNA polymerase-3 subunit epsilon
MALVGGLDLETTGLSQPDGHRIIEIALCLYDLDTEEFKGKFVQRINPQRPIDPKAQAVHGISFDQVAMCPVWDEIAPKVSKILSKVDVLIAHNGEGFDIPFLYGEFARLGIAAYPQPLVDTMLQARWATPYGKYPTLGELCFACDVEYDHAKAHGAEYDVDVMVKSFFKGYKRGFFTTGIKEERLAA